MELAEPVVFFHKRFKLKKDFFSFLEDKRRILSGIHKRIRRANDVYFRPSDHKKGHYRFTELIPLKIEYGNGKKIDASGLLTPPMAKELVEAGLLKKTDKHLELAILDVPEGNTPTREQVNTHFSKIANWALDKGYISGLREPLYLADQVDEARKDEYACYDRNLDFLGLVVHSEAIIIELTDGPYKGNIVVARRHDDFIEKKHDSVFDIASGAVTSRYTRSETHASELLDEFDIKGDRLKGIEPIYKGDMDTVTTARYRGQFGILRERMRVSVLGITHAEFEKLQCNDRKLVGDKRLITNVGYYHVAPDDMLKALSLSLEGKDGSNITFLKNAKALAMILYLVKKGHFKKMFPYARNILRGVSISPPRRFSITAGRWRVNRGTLRRNPHESIFAPR